MLEGKAACRCIHTGQQPPLSNREHQGHFSNLPDASCMRTSSPIFQIKHSPEIWLLKQICFERVSAVLISATFYSLWVQDPHRTKLQIKAKEN